MESLFHKNCPARLVAAVAIVLTLLSPLTQAAETASAPPDPVWQTDLTKAQAEARRAKKPVLLLFTGSDWCRWCQVWQKEVFSTAGFKDFAREKLVLVEVDFPRAKPMPMEQHMANLKLSEHYGIVGFPWIVVLGPDGKKLGEFGYSEGGISRWLSQINKALSSPEPEGKSTSTKAATK